MQFRAAGCMFCDGTPLSKEHIWGKWLQSIANIPHDPNERSIHYLYNSNKGENSGKFLKGSNANSGNALSVTSKVVCRHCNNGWMSKIEKRMQKLFELIFVQNTLEISVENKKKLRDWLLLKTCVLEKRNIPISWCTATFVETVNSQQKQRWVNFKKTKDIQDVGVLVFRSKSNKWGDSNFTSGIGFTHEGPKVFFMNVIGMGPMSALIWNTPQIDFIKNYSLRPDSFLDLKECKDSSSLKLRATSFLNLEDVALKALSSIPGNLNLVKVYDFKGYDK